MSIAVVIITASRDDHLRRTLAGLARQSRKPDEVVVVRMRPGEPLVQETRLPLTSVDLDTGGSSTLPLGRARNLGADATMSDQLIFLDVDCIPADDLVARYGDAVNAQPTALACGPARYLREGWHETSADDPSSEALHQASAAHPARPVIDDGTIIGGSAYELFWSLSFGLQRSTWDILGGFDETFHGYGAEDTDFGYRARQLGIPLVWFGGGTAFHQWHPPTRLDPDRTPEIVANALAFRRRWGSWPMTGWLTELDRLGRVAFDPAADTLTLVQP